MVFSGRAFYDRAGPGSGESGGFVAGVGLAPQKARDDPVPHMARVSVSNALLAVCALTGSLAAAPVQDPGPESARGRLTRPDPEGVAPPVSVGVYLIDLYAIDDVAQEFTADFLLTTKWRDPRLARPDAEDSGEVVLAAEQVRNPAPLLLNARSMGPGDVDLVRVSPQGDCTYVQRFTGSLSFRSDLADFPLDRQALAVSVVVPPRANWVLLDSRTRTYERFLPQLDAQVQVFESPWRSSGHRLLRLEDHPPADHGGDDVLVRVLDQPQVGHPARSGGDLGADADRVDPDREPR